MYLTWFDDCQVCIIGGDQGPRNYLGVARFTEDVTSWLWIVQDTGVVQHAATDGAGEALDVVTSSPGCPPLRGKHLAPAPDTHVGIILTSGNGDSVHM